MTTHPIPLASFANEATSTCTRYTLFTLSAKRMRMKMKVI